MTSGFITRRVPRLTPPDRGIILNAGHPIARDLQYWYPSPQDNAVWRDYSIHDRGSLTLNSGTSSVIATHQGNRAMDFSAGASEFVESDTSGFDGKAAVTVGFWASESAYASNQGAIALHGANSGLLLLIYPFESSGGNGVKVFWAGEIVNQNGADIADRAFHHFVFTSRSATDHELYVDGISIAQPTDSRNFTSYDGSLDIAHWNGSQNFTGQLKDITIHDRSMTSAEVKAWYQPENRWALYAPQTQHIPVGFTAAGAGGIYRRRHIGFHYG